ncbi:MAG: DUF3127 domain-containing protein [Bacteroidota bacterium]
MQLTARLIKVLPPVTGNGKNGTWKKQEFIVETTASQYPKKVCLSVWGDKINIEQFQEGTTLNISFDPESREYNNRWYTELRAWKIDVSGDTRQPSPAPDREMSYRDVPPPSPTAENDLRF